MLKRIQLERLGIKNNFIKWRSGKSDDEDFNY